MARQYVTALDLPEHSRVPHPKSPRFQIRQDLCSVYGSVLFGTRNRACAQIVSTVCPRVLRRLPETKNFDLCPGSTPLLRTFLKRGWTAPGPLDTPGLCRFKTIRENGVEPRPHVRGEDSTAEICRLPHQRNTPTCVGKTRTNPPGLCLTEKHPYVRGEDEAVRQRAGG